MKELKNIIFIEKGLNLEIKNKLYTNTIKKIDLDSFINKMFDSHKNLEKNKIILIEYEDIKSLQETIIGKERRLIPAYLKYMVLVSDKEDHNLDNNSKPIEKISTKNLNNHLEEIFDIYTKTLVLSENIINNIKQKIKNMVMPLNEDIINSMKQKTKDGVFEILQYNAFIDIEKITYLQEIRFCLSELNHTTISCDEDCFKGSLETIVLYIIKNIKNGVDDKIIIDNIINVKFEFWDETRLDINEKIRIELEKLSDDLNCDS